MKTALLETALVGLIATTVAGPRAIAAERCHARLALDAVAEPGIPSWTVRAGADVAASVYREFGVTIEYPVDGAASSLSTIPSRRIVVKASATRADREAFDGGNVLGLSRRNGEAPGHVGHIFYDAVVNAARRHDLPPGFLMGYAIAHELGHLLLPAGHGESGVMRADWEQNGLIGIRQRTLAMGDREAVLICQYLESGGESR